MIEGMCQFIQGRTEILIMFKYKVRDHVVVNTPSVNFYISHKKDDLYVFNQRYQPNLCL